MREAAVVTEQSETSFPVPAAGDRLTAEQLRELFLFAELSDEQLAWISDHGDVVEVAMGSTLASEGEAASCFFVLLSGQIAMSKTIGGNPVETTRSDYRGAYFGAVQFYLDDESTREYGATVRAVSDAVLLALPAREFAGEFARWFPMAVHLLEGMLLGMRQGNALIGERERLLALGKLSAGLTHELNNPAAAAGRATVALRAVICSSGASRAIRASASDSSSPRLEVTSA